MNSDGISHIEARQSLTRKHGKDNCFIELLRPLYHLTSGPRPHSAAAVEGVVEGSLCKQEFKITRSRVVGSLTNDS